jgi:hypothetical protein
MRLNNRSPNTSGQVIGTSRSRRYPKCRGEAQRR